MKVFGRLDNTGKLELLGSRFNNWNLLLDTEFFDFRQHNGELKSFCSKTDDLVYCNDFSAVLNF